MSGENNKTTEKKPEDKVKESIIVIKEYMKEKQIRMVVDKKSLLLADENLDITQEIIKRLNKKLKSIKLN